MIVPYELTDKMKVCKFNSNIRVTRYFENAPSKIQTNVQESLLVFIPDEYIREIRNFNKKEFIYDRGLKNIPYIQGCIGENLQYEVNQILRLLSDEKQDYEEILDLKIKELLLYLLNGESAERLNMSISTFKRKFVNTYGETPGKWINNKKLQKAIGLLNTTDYLITDICFLCGFESISTFNVQFKKNFGMTPTQFLRKINL